jgi:aryl-alcohol dehydrogenase-like predicted oxidoreductase
LAATLRRAHAVHPIAALEVEYAVITREIERETLPALRELGVALVAYGVLSRGLIGGAVAGFTAAGD